MRDYSVKRNRLSTYILRNSLSRTPTANGFWCQKTQKLETKGIEVVVYKDKATGEEMPGIQLPCIIQLYGSSTGKKIFTMELPFLYVKKASLVITCSLGSMSQLSRECK